MDCPDFGVCNPSVIQPNVRRQATFLNRDTESVVALTPNIRLVESISDPKVHHQVKQEQIRRDETISAPATT